MAAVINLHIDQGTTWKNSFLVRITDGTVDAQNKPVYTDLTGTWTGRAQVRASVSDPAPLYTFTVTVAVPIVTISVEPDVSTGWAWTSGAYDVEIESDSGEVLRIAQGRVTVSREVTR